MILAMVVKDNTRAIIDKLVDKLDGISSMVLHWEKSVAINVTMLKTTGTINSMASHPLSSRSCRRRTDTVKPGISKIKVKTQ